MAVSKHSRRFLALSFVVAFGVVPADSAKLPGGGTIDPAFNEAIANTPGKSIVASGVTDDPPAWHDTATSPREIFVCDWTCTFQQDPWPGGPRTDQGFQGRRNLD